MRQATIKLKRISGAVNIVNNSNLQSRVLHSLVASFGVLGVLYAVLLGTMVVNIVERRALEADMRTVASEVSELELAYLSLSGSIDQNLGASLGFREQEAKFTTRKSLTLNNDSGRPLSNINSSKNEI